mmetsp:Transcript_144802/g.464100  ORF Transcript_144802/g.464100 Transcript_144802/m.464100 type:complete len:121 (-) Transcript_144802:111-473(-)
MGFVHHARWARCRAANVSPWARQMNLILGGHRGLAAASALRAACAEVRPALSFPEQSPLSGGSAGLGGGDVSELGSDEGSLEMILDQILVGTASNPADCFFDLLDLQSGCWISPHLRGCP